MESEGLTQGMEIEEPRELMEEVTFTCADALIRSVRTTSKTFQ